MRSINLLFTYLPLLTYLPTLQHIRRYRAMPDFLVLFLLSEFCLIGQCMCV